MVANSPVKSGPLGPGHEPSIRRKSEDRDGNNATNYHCLMDAPASYFHWGFILLSVPNLLLLAGMIVLFVLALFIPMGSEEPAGGEEEKGR